MFRTTDSKLASYLYAGKFYQVTTAPPTPGCERRAPYSLSGWENSGRFSDGGGDNSLLEGFELAK